jgi:hypothetical protein
MVMATHPFSPSSSNNLIVVVLKIYQWRWHDGWAPSWRLMEGIVGGEARFSPSLNRLHEVDFGILGSSAANTPIPLHKIGLV